MSQSSNALFLFRAFFPSWKFFNDSGSQPRLLYKLAEENLWQPAAEEAQGSLRQLFLNPVGNLAHAAASLVDRLLIDATDIPAERLSRCASYLLVENLVRAQILKQNAARAGQHFVFKIEITSPEVEDVLLSEEHEV